MNSRKDGISRIGLPVRLPPSPEFDARYRRAPVRNHDLSPQGMALAVRNALRYIPEELHVILAPELLNELLSWGRIYGYRYMPPKPPKARPVDEYTGILEARALQLMIDNNLDPAVALYPYELVTYGESGQVCQNWMQYSLLRQYLEVIDEEQTLVVSSGHPLGLFPSRRDAPRVISTNGLMVGMFDTPDGFQTASALGVANYGQGPAFR